MPLGPGGEVTDEPLALLRPYPVLVGLFATATFAMHGAVYLQLRTDGGLRLVKIFLAIRRETQARRLAERTTLTPIDRAAAATWPALQAAYDQMLARTAPWIVSDNNDEHDRRDPLAGLRAIVTNLGGGS